MYYSYITEEFTISLNIVYKHVSLILYIHSQMSMTPLLFLKQDAREDFIGDEYVRATNQRRKKCIQILKVNHTITHYNVLVNFKFKREFPHEMSQLSLVYLHVLPHV